MSDEQYNILAGRLMQARKDLYRIQQFSLARATRELEVDVETLAEEVAMAKARRDRADEPTIENTPHGSGLSVPGHPYWGARHPYVSKHDGTMAHHHMPDGTVAFEGSYGGRFTDGHFHKDPSLRGPAHNFWSDHDGYPVHRHNFEGRTEWKPCNQEGEV